MAQVLAECHKEGSLVLDRSTRPGTVAVYEPWMHFVETRGAELLTQRVETARLSQDPEPYLEALKSVGPSTEAAVTMGCTLGEGVAVAVSEWGAAAKLNLGDEQREGVINALLHPVSILTGLPGTGKTTSLKAVVRILQDSSIPFLLCAPTGIAAKNLSAMTGAPASTIHRAFSAKGSGNDSRDTTYAGIVGESGGTKGDTGEHGVWGYDESHPYPAEVVIIDEASMVDQHLLYRLVACTAPNTRLVFVGDHAQLPSVGPGNVLRNLIESGRFPVVSLTEIYRQKGTSDIVHAAHAIHRGDVPNTDPPSDFVLLPLPTETDVHNAICRLAVKLYDKRVNFQILSPRHGGAVGVTNLNASLRELLNPRVPGVQEVKRGSDVIRENDRIMIVKNNYAPDKMVFNGDVGKVSRVDHRKKMVRVKVFGEPASDVDFKFSELGRHLRLAYACTVHKAQGLEYNTIVMPIVDGFHHQLQRNLLYTAVTRARERVFLIGTHSALTRAVSNAKEDLRDTLLVDRLL
jgi:exodeoxyribonuclease V alpha subunit